MYTYGVCTGLQLKYLTFTLHIICLSATCALCNQDDKLLPRQLTYCMAEKIYMMTRDF